MDVITIDTPELGDRSYLVSDGTFAVVFDPQRDVDRLFEMIDGRKLSVTHVFETHLHNDYVSGGLELARSYGAEYVVAGGRLASYECCEALEGMKFRSGALVAEVVATPGHTQDHASYVVTGGDGTKGVFTGGSMLYGTVGRTDLVSQELTESLTRSQYRSVRRLAYDLEGFVEVYPTHGFGSFCASSPTSGSDSSTVALERVSNVACTTLDEDVFVENIISSLSAYPSYYKHMGLLNRAGTGGVFSLQLPRELTLDDIQGKPAVIDVRNRLEFAAGHVPGSVNIEMSDMFATYVGWLFPRGLPLYLIATSIGAIEKVQRDLIRIGIDAVAGVRLLDASDSGACSASYQVSSFEDLGDGLSSGRGLKVLDVRSENEWKEGHILGANHVPIHELVSRLDDVPNGEVWVHCASGFRASIACSLAESDERKVVLVDDDWSNFRGS